MSNYKPRRHVWTYLTPENVLHVSLFVPMECDEQRFVTKYVLAPKGKPAPRKHLKRKKR